MFLRTEVSPSVSERAISRAGSFHMFTTIISTEHTKIISRNNLIGRRKGLNNRLVVVSCPMRRESVGGVSGWRTGNPAPIGVSSGGL